MFHIFGMFTCRMLSATTMIAILLLPPIECQFKIIGLLENTSVDSNRTETNSPMVKIGSLTIAADTATLTVEGRGFISSAIRETNNTISTSVRVDDLNTTSISTLAASAESPVAAVVEHPKTNVKLRIMDDSNQLPVPSLASKTLTVADMAEYMDMSDMADMHGDDNNIVQTKLPQVVVARVYDPLESIGNTGFMHKPARVRPKSFMPNIRKFAYAEERSFHKNAANAGVRNSVKASVDADNEKLLTAEADRRRHELKLKKITKYRNSFKTRCRCERISNCPRIQITIHRCDQDYFMCCF